MQCPTKQTPYACLLENTSFQLQDPSFIQRHQKLMNMGSGHSTTIFHLHTM